MANLKVHGRGFTEVWRLVKIASPEVKTLSVAFAFLLVSSGITMSLPFSIGKIIDIATKSDGSVDMLFGLRHHNVSTSLWGAS